MLGWQHCFLKNKKAWSTPLKPVEAIYVCFTKVYRGRYLQVSEPVLKERWHEWCLKGDITASCSQNNLDNAKTVSFLEIRVVKGCVIFGRNIQSNTWLSSLLQGSVQQHAILGKVLVKTQSSAMNPEASWFLHWHMFTKIGGIMIFFLSSITCYIHQTNFLITHS